MKKKLSDYLLLTEKEYNYRLKFAVELQEEQLNKLERFLQKYDLLDVASVHKSMIQKNPMDFPNLDIGEVYIIDIVTRLPISTETLVQEMSKVMKIHVDLIRVRDEHSPYEQYTNQKLEYEDTEYQSKLEDPDYKDAPKMDRNLYGDAYNKEMIDTIIDAQGREPTENEKKSKFKAAFDKAQVKSPFTDVDNKVVI
jgi:hypothetical protein